MCFFSIPLLVPNSILIVYNTSLLFMTVSCKLNLWGSPVSVNDIKNDFKLGGKVKINKSKKQM